MCVIRVCMCESVDSRDPQLYEAALRESVLLLEEAFARERGACFKPITGACICVDVRWWMVARSGYGESY